VAAPFGELNSHFITMRAKQVFSPHANHSRPTKTPPIRATHENLENATDARILTYRELLASWRSPELPPL